MPDALGVVEPVDAEQDRVRLVQGLPDLGRALADAVPPRDLLQGLGVDRDRERRGADLAVTGPDRRPPRGQARRPAAGAQEVRGVGAALEAEQVRAEQPVDHLAAPGQLGEDLVAGKRDVVEEADPDVAALLADHLRNQLQLVVVHPDRRPVLGLVHGGLRERPVDGHVRVPPPAMELGRRDDVVVQRPQRRVAEALVVVPDLIGGQADAHQVQVVGPERPGCGPRVAGPADPHAARLAHDRFQRADQPAGTRPPLCLAVRALGPVDRQPAGHHHEPVPPGDSVVVCARRRYDSWVNANAHTKAQLCRRPERFTQSVSRLLHRRHPSQLMHAIGRLGHGPLSSYSRQREQ